MWGSSFLAIVVPAFSDALSRVELLAQGFRPRYGLCPSGLQSAGAVGDRCVGALVAVGDGRPE